MNDNDNGTIEVITRSMEDESRSTGVRLVSQVLDVGELRDHFHNFMQQLQSIVAIGDQNPGLFQLHEIQFSAEITGNGDFKLLGTGVGVEAKSSITFVLQRQTSDK